jgi:K+-transporting ATPase ATPase A chain
VTPNGWLQIALYVGFLIVLSPPLGRWIARVYAGERHVLARVCGPVERAFYRLADVNPEIEQRWTGYAVAVLAFSAAGFALTYLLQRLQGWLPLNPVHMGAVPPELAFNTAVSFATNTNWQAYGGETTLSYFTQMVALTVQNFVSAAAGMAVLVALARGIARRSADTVGNFWVDLTRGTLYILLPLSFVLAIALVSQGVVQTFHGPATAQLVQPLASGDSTVTQQVISVGPAASQVAIKQLGTNGGGFFNVNSAHPFENPSPVSDLLESLAILLIPAALCFAFGRLVDDRRQGRAIFAAMLVILIPLLVFTGTVEQRGTPLLERAGADVAAGAGNPGGNYEGKEVRFGIANSAVWAVTTTAASNGSVNSMHDSFTPLGGMVPMWLIQLGEVVFGGVGSGLYGMLAFVIVAVFVAGLMVGRTPEYLGKKIEAYEMKMASLVILVPALVVLIGTAAAVATVAGRVGPSNPGPHGFGEILYAFSSASNNNGSAFAGLAADGTFYTLALGAAMVIGRFWVMIPILAIAGSLAGKKRVPPGPGTLPTHTPLFVVLLVGTVLLVGALTFFPALALGPVAEHLAMWSMSP